MSGAKLNTRYYTWSGILLLVLTLVFSACGNSTSTNTNSNTSSCKHPISLSQLNLGVIPAENATKVEDTTKPFADKLGQLVCKKVNLFVGTNYTATITAMSARTVDVAWFGPLSYAIAASKTSVEAIARQLTTDGKDHYNSYIITTPKTGIKTVEDLKGHTFSFTDAASTSGNLMPRYVMKQHGLDPEKDLKYKYVGSHDISLTSVLNGTVDAGAVASDTYNEYLSQGKFKEGDLVIVDKSIDIPESPIAVRGDLSQSDKDAIQAAFLDIKDKNILTAVDAGGFIKDSDSSYNFVRDLARTLGLDLKKMQA